MHNATLTLECPRLRQDITFLETIDGMYVRGGGFNFTIAGKGVYQLMSALLPHLDGTTPLASLLDTVGPQQREIIVRFLSALESKGLLHEGALPANIRDDETLQGFSSQRALLTDMGAPSDAIARIVDATVTVVGGAHAVEPMVRLLEGNGVAVRNGGCQIRDWSDELVEDSIVIALATEEDAHRLLDLADRAQGVAHLVPVWQQGERVLIGPWQGREDGAVVRSAVARAAASEGGTPYVSMAFGIAEPQPTLGRATYEAIAALLSFEVFKILGQVDDGALRQAVLSTRTDTLQTLREPLTLEPEFFPGADSLPVAKIEHPTNPVEWDEEALYRRYAALVGDPCGLFTRFDDDGLRQLPIKVGLLRSPIAGGDIIGTNMEHVLGARLDALVSASSLYAVRRVRAQQTTGDALERIQPEALSSWLGGRPLRERWVTALDVEGNARFELPWEAVAAGPHHRSPVCYQPDLHGVGVGPVWDMAVEKAAFSAWAHDTARRAEAGTIALHEVRLDTAAAELAPLHLLVNSLAQVKGVRVFAPSNGAPLAVIVASTERVAYWATADTWVDAAVRALSALVAREQLADLHGKDAMLRFAANTMSLASLKYGAELGEASAFFDASSDPWGRLADEGFEPMVVDITTPDLREVVHVARVLLRVKREETNK